MTAHRVPVEPGCSRGSATNLAGSSTDSHLQRRSLRDCIQTIPNQPRRTSVQLGSSRPARAAAIRPAAAPHEGRRERGQQRARAAARVAAPVIASGPIVVLSGPVPLPPPHHTTRRRWRLHGDRLVPVWRRSVPLISRVCDRRRVGDRERERAAVSVWYSVPSISSSAFARVLVDDLPSTMSSGSPSPVAGGDLPSATRW